MHWLFSQSFWSTLYVSGHRLSRTHVAQCDMRPAFAFLLSLSSALSPGHIPEKPGASSRPCVSLSDQLRQKHLTEAPPFWVKVTSMCITQMVVSNTKKFYTSSNISFQLVSCLWNAQPQMPYLRNISIPNTTLYSLLPSISRYSILGWLNFIEPIWKPGIFKDQNSQ